MSYSSDPSETRPTTPQKSQTVPVDDFTPSNPRPQYQHVPVPHRSGRSTTVLWVVLTVLVALVAFLGAYILLGHQGREKVVVKKEVPVPAQTAPAQPTPVARTVEHHAAEPSRPASLTGSYPAIRGKIGKSDVNLSLNFYDGNISGEEWYTNGSGDAIEVSGSYGEDGTFYAAEFYEGECTGQYEGRITELNGKYFFDGSFVNYKGKRFQFHLEGYKK